MKMRRVLALVMAVLMVIGLMPAVAAVDTDAGATTLGPVVATKDLVCDEDGNPVKDREGWYTLTLSVKGDMKEMQKHSSADVILVVDNSGSMADTVNGDVYCYSTDFTWNPNGWDRGFWECDKCGERYYGYFNEPAFCTKVLVHGKRMSKLEIAKDVLSAFADSLLTDGSDIRLGVVGFNMPEGKYDNGITVSTVTSNNRSGLLGYSEDNINTIKNAINSLTAEYGTDYTAALKFVQNMLNQRDGADKTRLTYIIFITDGEPGATTSNPTGGIDKESCNGTIQAKELKKDRGAIKGTTIFTIGIGIGSKEGKELLNDKIASPGMHKDIDVNQDVSEQLSSTLNTWKTEIIQYAGTNGKLVDEISDNFTTNIESLALPEGMTYADGKITWDIGNIGSEEKSFSFKIKPNEGLEPGVYETNSAYLLTYDDPDGNGQKVELKSPTVTINPVVKFVIAEDDKAIANFGTDKYENSVEVTYNELLSEDEVIEPTIINSDKYEFAGWTDEQGNDVEVDFSSKITSNITYIAKFSEKTVGQEKIAIEFNVGVGNWKDGSENLPKEFTLIKDAAAMNAPEVADSNFIGWFVKDSSGAESEFKLSSFGYDDIELLYEFYAPGTVNEDNIQTLYVYAKYTDKPVETPAFRVEFNANGGYWTDGSEATDPKTVDIFEDTENIIVPGVDKDNADFLGWYIKDESNNIHKIDFDKGFGYDTASAFADVYPVNEIDGVKTLIVFAQYKDNDEQTYTVTYKFESGTEGAVLPWNVNEQLPVNNSYSIGEEVTVAAKPNDVVFGEYTWKFQGWKLGETDITPNSKVPMVKGGLEIVGIWTRTSSQYPVTYKFESGTEGADLPWNVNEQLPVNNSTYSIGQEVTVAAKPNDVVFGEYTWKFQGWKLGETDIIPNSKVPMVEGGLTFVGIWTSEIITPEPPVTYYTVTYTDGVENEEVFADQIFRGLKSGAETPAYVGDLIRDGYTFAGWNPTVSATVTENVTYTAQWKLNSDTPIDPPFIVIFPTLEISNKVIAPKNFEKTSFEYDIINVKTGDVEKSVTLKADSSVRVMVTGGTEYMVVPKNLEVPGYIVTTTSTPDSATVTSDKIGNVSVDFTHIYVVGLNTEDHYAYIRGYEDGTIRPEGNITRAEVATIFYRLLSSEALEAFKTTEDTFTDVDSDAWYNLSVSTLAKAGVISGYPDGSFNPNGKITRAELVSIATRFFTTIEVGDSKFSDIAGHWAAKAIDEAYIKGIIKGYSDGTFRPDQAVTRAEAMKIVNGILGRPIDTCVLIEGIKLWPDVASEAWYYYVVAEATNAHRYELTTPEKWTAIIIDEIEY